MRNLSKNFLIVVVILLTISAVFALVSSNSLGGNEQISLSQLAEEINRGRVEQIVVSGNELTVSFHDTEEQATATKELDSSLSETLLNLGVTEERLREANIAPEDATGLSSILLPLSFVILPLLLFIFFFWFMFRQARTGVSQAFDFTKARAKLFGAENQKERVTFKDVAGLKEPKEELEEVVDFLKNPNKYLQIGAKIPRGVLLTGPPGTGKTLLARAVATEANVPFFSASGSEFIEMFVGVGSSRVRDLFATAKKAGKSIIFIDELDAIGRVRGMGMTGGHEEREQTLNQILVEMDGFDRNSTVIVFGATNRADVLDPALLRPGRFDRRIVLDLPDVNEREEILKIHSRSLPLASDVNLREIAERTPGFSGADLANLTNEGAIFAARQNKKEISQADLLSSIEKVLLGPERKSRILSKREKEITAYHEGGHALVAASLPHADPVRKISIISRGRAGGYTLKLPSEEKHLRNRAEFLEELAVLLGGYTAEKLVFGDITTGPSNDLAKASEIARQLVTELGMSEKLGPVTYGDRDSSSLFPGEFGEGKQYSEDTAETIDKEVSLLINDARATADRILRQKRDILDKIAQVLVERETIEREEFEELIGGKKTKKSDPRGKTLAKD